MRSKARDDQTQAQREADARRVLLDRGADELDRRPWQPRPVPPSAVDLIQFFLWQSAGTDAQRRDEAPRLDGQRVVEQDPGRREAVRTDADPRTAALAALQLLPAARAEIDQLEVGLLFAARGFGLTWAEMARALGLNSPQACQQRLDRLTSRQAAGE